MDVNFGLKVKRIRYCSRPGVGMTLLLLAFIPSWTGWRTLEPIGHIESCYTSKFGTPRQGSVAPDALAKLRIQLGDGLNERVRCCAGHASHFYRPAQKAVAAG